MKLALIPSAVLLIAAAFFSACSEKHNTDDGHDHGTHSDGDGHDDAESKGAQHGAAGAVPGSYADWCAEHAVPESKCTRCDTSLVAAFKATNDWCAEHGLPESQCLKCDPDLKIERPSKPAGGK